VVVLQGHVDDEGLVDYAKLKTSPQKLNAFVADLSKFNMRVYQSWPDNEKMAFWINAYNALTMKSIVDNYPIRPTFPNSFIYPKSSIRQIKGVWDKLEFNVMGRAVTLEHIEHKVFRRVFKKPRIHLALNSASKGCVPLRREPYEGALLMRQLDDQTVRVVKNSRHFRIDRKRSRVHLSLIFDWFGEDFIEKYGAYRRGAGISESEGAVLNLLGGYLPQEDADYLETGAFSIEYIPYDWSLNEQK